MTDQLHLGATVDGAGTKTYPDTHSGNLTAHGQFWSANYVSVTGTGTYVGSLSPALTAYVPWMEFTVCFISANSGAATLNLNGLGAINLQLRGSPLAAGDIPAGARMRVVYDGTNFQIIGAAGSGGSTIAYGTATGTNTYAATMTPVVSSYVVGAMYSVLFINGNTGASTIDLGPGAKTLQLDGAGLASGAIPANSTLQLLYDAGGNLQILGISNAAAVPRMINVTIVNSFGAVIAAGTKGDLPKIQVGQTITDWYLVSNGNVAGSITIDVRRSTALGTEPVTSMVGGGGTYPNLTSQATNSGNTSSWASNTLAVGDRLEFYVVSATTIYNCTLELRLL